MQRARDTEPEVNKSRQGHVASAMTSQREIPGRKKRQRQLQMARATKERGQRNGRSGGGRFPRRIPGTAATADGRQQTGNVAGVGRRGASKVGGGRVAQGALAQPLDESLLGLPLEFHVVREGRGRPRGRQDGPGAEVGGRRQRDPPVLFDGERRHAPPLVQLVPVALGADALQVGVVAVATQRRNHLFHDRLIPLQRPVLLPDRVQIVDPVELELRLDAAAAAPVFRYDLYPHHARYMLAPYSISQKLFVTRATSCTERRGQSPMAGCYE